MIKNEYLNKLLTSGGNTQKRDILLYNFILKHCKNIDLIKCFNRGTMFEIALTNAPKVEGVKGKMSSGDFVFNGLICEIKYITTKSPCDDQLKGTIATHYLIGFNYGNMLDLRLIKKSDIIKNGLKIKFKDNKDKGESVEIFTL